MRKVLQDSFFDKGPVGRASPFERVDEDDNALLFQLMHQIVFGHHSQGEGATIIPRSFLRIRER